MKTFIKNIILLLVCFSLCGCSITAPHGNKDLETDETLNVDEPKDDNEPSSNNEPEEDSFSNENNIINSEENKDLDNLLKAEKLVFKFFNTLSSILSSQNNNNNNNNEQKSIYEQDFIEKNPFMFIYSKNLDEYHSNEIIKLVPLVLIIEKETIVDNYKIVASASIATPEGDMFFKNDIFTFWIDSSFLITRIDALYYRIQCPNGLDIDDITFEMITGNDYNIDYSKKYTSLDFQKEETQDKTASANTFFTNYLKIIKPSFGGYIKEPLAILEQDGYVYFLVRINENQNGYKCYLAKFWVEEAYVTGETIGSFSGESLPSQVPVILEDDENFVFAASLPSFDASFQGGTYSFTHKSGKVENIKINSNKGVIYAYNKSDMLASVEFEDMNGNIYLYSIIKTDVYLINFSKK